MAKNIPKVLSTFVSSDSDTARMYSNLQAAVQPLLDFNAKWFSVKGSVLNVTGALQSLGAAVLTSFRAVPDGTLLAPGLAFLSNGTIGIERQGAGNSEQLNFRFNGVTFLSITKGGYIWTSFSSTSAISFNNALGNLIGSISNAGVLNFPSYISGSGFKGPVYAGSLTNVTLNGSGGSPTVFLAPNGIGNYMVMPFAGSVTAVVCVTTSTSAAVAFYFSKNGAVVWNIPGTSPAGTTQIFYTPVAKNTYQFAAGDSLILSARSNTTSTAAGVYVNAYLWVEVGA